MTDDVTPPAPAPAPPAPPAPTVTPAPAGETLEQAKARLNAEAAAWRIQAQQATTRATELEGQLTNERTASQQRIDETARTERARAEALKPKIVDAELKAALANAGVLDPDLVGLVPRNGIAIDENGNATGVKEAVDAFKAAKPQFFRAPGDATPLPAVRQSGSPAAPPANPIATPPDARGMDPKAYNDFKQGMRRRLRGGTAR